MEETTTQPEVEIAQPEAQEGVQPDVVTTEPEASQPTIKVKYNKEEKELSLDEAREFAEKGMNYDKIKERLQTLEQEFNGVKTDRDKLQSSKALKWAQEQAVKRNMMTDDFIGMLQDSEYAKEHGVTVDEAKRIRTENEKSRTLSDENQTLKSKLSEIESAQKAREAANEEAKAFREKYPDVGELPDEVIKKIQRGTPLMEAYEEYVEIKGLRERMKELEEKVKVDTVNKENADASTGKLGDQSDGHEPELTQERIDKMTPDELKKNHAKVWSFLTGKG